MSPIASRVEPRTVDSSCLAILIYSSRPETDLLEWSDRFDRYIKGTSARHRSFVVARSADCLEWIRGTSDCFGLAIWDAAGNVPPKEIDSLIAQSEDRVIAAADRYAAGSVARGVGGLRWSAGRMRSELRRACGWLSDPNPTCILIRRKDAIDLSAAWAKQPSRDWIRSICRAARRNGISVAEVPIMWSR